MISNHGKWSCVVWEGEGGNGDNSDINESTLQSEILRSVYISVKAFVFFSTLNMC